MRAILILLMFSLNAYAVDDRQAFYGCAEKSNMVFELAAEKLYNGGSTDKFAEYLHKEFPSDAEFRLNAPILLWMAKWVDDHSYADQVKGVRDNPNMYVAAFFAECIVMSYQHIHIDETRPEATEAWESTPQEDKTYY